jgi:hypothetical protein
MWSGVMAEQAVSDQPATPRVPLLGPHFAAGAASLDSARGGRAVSGRPTGAGTADGRP